MAQEQIKGRSKRLLGCLILALEGNEILREASKWSPELAAACEVLKEIQFEFEAMDTL